MPRHSAVPPGRIRRTRTPLRGAFAFLALLTLPAAARASDASTPGSAPTNAEPGWHVIRPGDTLESLAIQYLGSADQWPEIHRLNPGIDDPHWIYPGRKIRVLVERPSAAPNAQVESLSRRVEARPLPVPWLPAEAGDLLLERDGLRTYANSSARLRFDDGTSATVSEDSLVFIRRQTPARAPAPRKEIEIERGQADLETHPSSGMRAPEIEIVVGAARSAARARPDGTLRARSRKEGEGAQFMVYDGQASVAAAGRRVDLAEGTGSVVPPAAPPLPAEKLLPAPTLLAPAEGAELGLDAPELAWQEVPGAARYVVEICGDAACGRVLERRADLAAPGATLEAELPLGAAYWRATAVALSGLDGYPSPPRAVTLVPSVAPPAPIVLLMTPDGRQLAEDACSPAAPRLEVRALDTHGNTLPWQVALDGTEGPLEDLVTHVTTGEHRLVATAVDTRGRRASSPELRFRVDLASPTVELPPEPGVSTPLPKVERRRRHRAEPPPPPVNPCASGLEVGRPEGAFLRIACADAGGVPTEVLLAGASDKLLLRSANGRTIRLGEFREVAPGSAVALEFADQGCGLARATFRIVPSPHAAGRALLEVAALDAAGRETRMSWHLDTP